MDDAINYLFGSYKSKIIKKDEKTNKKIKAA
jgi:hypothetical protein